MGQKVSEIQQKTICVKHKAKRIKFVFCYLYQEFSINIVQGLP